MNKEKQIQEYIKKNFNPVEDKPGYVWFNQRNFQIISIETLAKSLEEVDLKLLEELKGE